MLTNVKTIVADKPKCCWICATATHLQTKYCIKKKPVARNLSQQKEWLKNVIYKKQFSPEKLFSSKIIFHIYTFKLYSILYKNYSNCPSPNMNVIIILSA